MMVIWSEVKYFKAKEFDCPDKMDPDFIARLDLVRREAGVPFYISSDFRYKDDRAHGHGVAVDITDDPYSDGITSQWRFKVVRAAMKIGITRIGVYDAHIHLDDWKGVIQEVLWVGTSE